MEHISKFMKKWEDKRSLEEKIYDLLEKIDKKLDKLEHRVSLLEEEFEIYHDA